MRRRQLQPRGVDPFRNALAFEELDLPREAAERMGEPKRRILGTRRPRRLAMLHPARPRLRWRQSAVAWLTIG
jgi:hypothetical protein